MSRLVGIFCIFFLTSAALCQSTPKYQVGTITDVKVHQADKGSASDAVSYDVSVKVGDTIYVVLYTPPLGDDRVKYVAGRDGLVIVGKKTIRYNDILGRSTELPIESQKPAANAREAKPAE